MDLFSLSSLGKYDLVLEHLKRNPNLGLIFNKEGWTTLMYACYYCHGNIANCLIAAQPNCVYITNNKKQTALMLACYSSEKGLIELVLRDDILQNTDINGWNALFYAVYYGQVDAVKLLISHGINLNCKDKDGKTALMIAASENMLNVVGILVMSDANASIISNDGKTALHYAIDKSHHEVADLLSIPRCSDLRKLLKCISLSKYMPIFEKNYVDLNEFLKMTEDDLKNMGIVLLGPRRKMTIVISKLNYLYGLVDSIHNTKT